MFPLQEVSLWVWVTRSNIHSSRWQIHFTIWQVEDSWLGINTAAWPGQFSRRSGDVISRFPVLVEFTINMFPEWPKLVFSVFYKCLGGYLSRAKGDWSKFPSAVWCRSLLESVVFWELQFPWTSVINTSRLSQPSASVFHPRAHSRTSLLVSRPLATRRLGR